MDWLGSARHKIGHVNASPVGDPIQVFLQIPEKGEAAIPAVPSPLNLIMPGYPLTTTRAI